MQIIICGVRAFSARLTSVMRLSFFFIVLILLNFSPVSAQTVVTAAGTVTWTISGTTSVQEVTLTRGATNHTDGLDGGLSLSVTGTNISFTSSYHLSSTYGALIQNIAITNNGGSASTFTLTSTGNLGSDGATRFHYTSATGPRYTISSDNASATTDGTDPVISFLYGNAALNSLTTSMPFTNLSDAVSFTVSNVPIAAGQTRRFLIVLGVGNIENSTSNRPSQALVSIQKLATGAWPADFTNFLTPTQLGQVMNWSSLSILPVTWMDFTAKPLDNKVKLEWKTAAELNTKNFTIQQSSDARNWKDIQEMDAAGQSSDVRTYSYIHAQPSAGANYYRIQQHDIDGKSSYSKIVKIVLENIQEQWKLYSNPTVNNMLELQLKKASLVNVYNGEGKRVFQKQLAQGYQQVSLSNQAKGIYYVEVNGRTERVLVQ